MSEQSVARVLDFSNVGLTPQQIMNLIQFPSHDDDGLHLPEQALTRARTDPNESTFAIGQNQISRHALGRARRPRPVASDENVSNIIVSATGSINRYFVLKKGMKSLFNPMTLDEFYAKPCPPGHVRIFRQLLPVGYGLVESPSYIQYANLMVTLPFNKFKKYIHELIYPFEKFYSSKATYSSNFNTLIEEECCVGKYSYNEVWHRFATIRYQMRRLANAFLLKKSIKKMMVIPNYITMEDPSPSNCIEWPDIQNRCSYRIHGDTLLNSMKMYLHHSEYGFPEPLWPKNPTTNAPFTYGQLIHLIYELYAWCGRNKKAVPYILTKFQEADYCLSKLIVMNRPELTLYACRELFTEINQPDAIEMWLDMVEEYAILFPTMTRDELEDEIPRWVTSLSDEKAFHQKDALGYLKEWSSIIPDLVQYSRFKYFNRSDWTTIITVKNLVKTLWAKTYHLIRRFAQAKKPPSPPASTTEESDHETSDIISYTSQTSNIQSLISGLNSASSTSQTLANIHTLIDGLHDTLSFRISSEWNTILDESSADTAAPSAVELEYNMMMFNTPVLPRLSESDDFVYHHFAGADFAASADRLYHFNRAPAPPAPAPAPAPPVPPAPPADAADAPADSFESVD